MQAPLTVAVAGTGFIGPVHVEALRRLGIHVKGILGSTPDKSEQARKALQLDKAYQNYEALLSDKELEAVHIAVPNVLHYEMAKAALTAGLHVMCEKPLAMTTAETAELVALAKSSGLEAGVCYNIRYYPMNLAARQYLAEGKIGDLFHIQGSYVQDWLMYDTDYNWRILSEKGGALRAIADIGTHWMDLLSFVTGKSIKAVFADLHIVHPKRKRPIGEVATFSDATHTDQQTETIAIDTEDGGSILFRFEDGRKGSMWISQVTAGRKNCLQYEIACSKGSLYWNSERPNELWKGHRNQPNELLLKDPALVDSHTAAFIHYPGGHNEGFPDTFKQCFKTFYDAVKGTKTSEGVGYPTFEEGHKEVALCEAILKSHQTEQWIQIK